jgi:3-oxoadipate enol-lactonase
MTTACRCGSFLSLLLLVLAPVERSYGLDLPVNGHGFAPVNGTRLYYEIQGEGPALVLLHGGQLDSRIWDTQFVTYARQFRVVRYDARGFGGSLPASQPYSDADDLAALLDYLKIPKAHLLGLSLGGRISINFALKHPDRVLSLMLAGPGLDGAQMADPGGMQNFMAVFDAAINGNSTRASELWLENPLIVPAMENPGLRERIRLMAYENAHVWLANYVLQKTEPTAAQRLPEIKLPTLVILGDRDVPPIKAIVEKIAGEVPGAQKVVIPGAGHLVNMERPEAFDAAVLGFLSRLPRPQQPSLK